MHHPSEMLKYSFNGGNVHQLPIHYHLGNNDRLAALDAINQGADPLQEDANGICALQLAYRQLFAVLNKSLCSPIPLGIKKFKDANRVEIPATRNGKPILGLLPFKKKSTAGQADYLLHLPAPESIGWYAKMQRAMEYFIENTSPLEGIHKTLYSRAKSLVQVIKAIAENPKYTQRAKIDLCNCIHLLQEPFLYYVVMDYICKGAHVNCNKIADARRRYNIVMNNAEKSASLLKFITQIALVIDDLFATFHFNIYQITNSRIKSLRPGYDSQLVLDNFGTSLVEIYAHMAFVTQANVMFQVLILQPHFDHLKSRFDWKELLITIFSSTHYKDASQVLLRKCLSDAILTRITNGKYGL
ncbi:hypothetical protein BdWA1_000226 [Babesia duncani]|uniref:Uncharacterized protein n=1 Tax=Babesia duncani TaxID=323732 RepID=A0AAD9PLX9_9APIC|nr:hypothetical protein BdWA1_000226 [Babesia duncani]